MHAIAKTADGYGRWLGFRQWSGELDAATHPANRVTPQRAGALLQGQQAADGIDDAGAIVGQIGDCADQCRGLLGPQHYQLRGAVSLEAACTARRACSAVSWAVRRRSAREDQVRVCRARADKEGWHVVKVFADHAISGATILRPEYQALLAA